ncbi:MAG: hypothetical protein AB8G23_23770 [Myxococcota bacterium]
MSTVSESIPPALQPDVEAALDWFNRDQAIPFEVTGILDPDEALAKSAPRELKLILCGGDRCEQRSFRVDEGGVGFLEDGREEASGQAEAGEAQAELDPPPGARRSWLDRTLDRNEFSVVLFYRGFW